MPLELGRDGSTSGVPSSILNKASLPTELLLPLSALAVLERLALSASPPVSLGRTSRGILALLLCFLRSLSEYCSDCLHYTFFTASPSHFEDMARGHDKPAFLGMGPGRVAGLGLLSHLSDSSAACGPYNGLEGGFGNTGFLRNPSSVGTAKPRVEVSGPQSHLLPLCRHAIALSLSDV